LGEHKGRPCARPVREKGTEGSGKKEIQYKHNWERDKEDRSGARERSGNCGKEMRKSGRETVGRDGRHTNAVEMSNVSTNFPRGTSNSDCQPKRAGRRKRGRRKGKEKDHEDLCLKRSSEEGSDSSLEGETSTIEELVSSCGSLRPHHDAYLELFKNAPNCFCKSQGGKRHSFELLVALMSRNDGLRFVGHTYDLTAYLLYSDNLALVRQPKTLKIPIFQVMEGSTGILKDGIASVRLRINDVARNHCCRKFRVALMPRVRGTVSAAVPDFAEVFNLGKARSASSKARLRQWESLCRLGLNVPGGNVDKETLGNENVEDEPVPKVACGNVEVEERIACLEQTKGKGGGRGSKGGRRGRQSIMVEGRNKEGEGGNDTRDGGGCRKRGVGRRRRKKRAGGGGGRKGCSTTLQAAAAMAASSSAAPSSTSCKREGSEKCEKDDDEWVEAVAACITEPITVISKIPWNERNATTQQRGKR